MFLGVIGAEEHIPKKSSVSPMIKAPLKTTDQEPNFRIDIKYSREHAFAFRGIVFPNKK